MFKVVASNTYTGKSSLSGVATHLPDSVFIQISRKTFNSTFHFFHTFWFDFSHVTSCLAPKWKVHWFDIRRAYWSLIFQITGQDAVIKLWLERVQHNTAHHHAGTNAASVFHCPTEMATSYFEEDQGIIFHTQYLKPDNRETHAVTHCSPGLAFGSCCLPAFRHFIWRHKCPKVIILSDGVRNKHEHLFFSPYDLLEQSFWVTKPQVARHKLWFNVSCCEGLNPW